MNDFATILEQAQALTGAQREAFLVRACKGDAALKQRLEGLLAASAKADEFFGENETSLDDATLKGPAEAEAPGAIIGRYKLREKIGEGGCGVVYVADQEEPVRRRVALKVIKLGMDTKSVIARFEAERQALAMMDHPNIAKVLDAGATAAGRPYFVMELVRGVKITEYCDQNNLSTTDRLDLFTKVCQAVQHAHQKGIIHRDLKPSNILVTLHDGVPVPKVIDFGISKATEGRLTDLTIYTELHQFIGTPAYMSPEQAEMSGLDIDTRSDIYSLGVLLYELLTGRTPFDARELIQAGIDEMRRTIREKEPARPSTCLSTMIAGELTTTAKRRSIEASRLIHILSGDLDWIVMKALEKDRTRRYESATSFAADIQRHLHNEPVAARPPSAIYKFQKAVRRNRLAYAAAGAVVVALVFGLISTQIQATRARRAEALANQRLADVTAERDAKEEARKEAEAVSKFLQEVFASPNPEQDGRTITVAETLDRAVQRLDRDLKDQPAVKARLQRTLSSTYYMLGLPHSAIPLEEKVKEYWERVAGPESFNSAVSKYNLAIYLSAVGRREEALRLNEESLALFRKLKGSEDPLTLGSMNNLALSYGDANRSEESTALHEELLASRRKLFGTEHPETIRSLGNVAMAFFNQGRKEEGLQLRKEALALVQKIHGHEHPRTIEQLKGLGIMYEHAGRRAEAAEVLERVLKLSRRVLGPEHPSVINMLDQLAMAYRHLGRLDESLALLEEQLRLGLKVLGTNHQAIVTALQGIGYSKHLMGRHEEAIATLEEAMESAKRILLPNDPLTSWVAKDLSDAYYAAGRKVESLRFAEQTLSIRRNALGLTNSGTLSAVRTLAERYAEFGLTTEALSLLKEALIAAQSREVKDSTIKCLAEIADGFLAVGSADDAIIARRTALEQAVKLHGTNHVRAATLIEDLGGDYLKAGQPEKARQALQSVQDRGIRRWLVLAPLTYKGDALKALREEQVPGEAAIRAKAGDRVTVNGGETTWQRYDLEGFVLGFDRLLGKQIENAVAYAVCYLKSDRDRQGLTMSVSSDDQARVYLNGKQVYENDEARGVAEVSDTVEQIELKRGLNTIVFKIVNVSAGWGGALNIMNPDGTPVDGLQVTCDPAEF